MVRARAVVGFLSLACARVRARDVVGVRGGGPVTKPQRQDPFEGVGTPPAGSLSRVRARAPERKW